jgi:hypothetical protein
MAVNSCVNEYFGLRWSGKMDRLVKWCDQRWVKESEAVLVFMATWRYRRDFLDKSRRPIIVTAGRAMLAPNLLPTGSDTPRTRLG